MHIYAVKNNKLVFSEYCQSIIKLLFEYYQLRTKSVIYSVYI